MQLGLGFCLAGYSTKVRVEVSLEGLGFESEKTYYQGQGSALLVVLQGLGLEVVQKGQGLSRKKHAIRVRVLPCWLFCKGQGWSCLKELGFESAKTCNQGQGSALLVILQGLGLELVYKGQGLSRQKHAIRVRVLLCWLFYKSQGWSKSTRVRV